VLLDLHRVARQLQHVLVGEREAMAVGIGNVDGAHRAAACAGLRRRLELHLDELRAQAAADDRELAGRQHGLVHVELVGVHCALHHRLAQAVTGGDEHHVPEARFGVHGEHHAGAAAVRADHALHPGRQGHLGVGETLVHAVGDGTVVVQRGKHVADAVEHGLHADHVQVGLLLTREGGIRQILGRGARPHRHRNFVRCVGPQPGMELTDLGLQRGRQRRRHHPGPDLGPGSGQRLDVLDVERRQPGMDPLLQLALAQEQAKRLGGRGEAVGHADSFLHELAQHLAQRSVLAADRLHVGHAQVAERDDVASALHGLSSLMSCGLCGRPRRAAGMRDRRYAKIARSLPMHRNKS